MTNVRVIIASPVRLVREGMVASLRGREGVVVADAVDMDPPGMETIADEDPDVVLVDVGERDPGTLGRLLNAANPRPRLVAFPLDEIDDRVFACAAAGFSGYVPRESG